MTTGEPAGWQGRRPGRPREQRADRAIIDATLELFADEGYYSLSMEAVAVKAGVSKATIYRRWAGKRELVIDALATLNDDFPQETDPLPPGGTRDRLLVGLEHMSNRDADSLAGRIRSGWYTASASPICTPSTSIGSSSPVADGFIRCCATASSAVNCGPTWTSNWPPWRSSARSSCRCTAWDDGRRIPTCRTICLTCCGQD